MVALDPKSAAERILPLLRADPTADLTNTVCRHLDLEPTPDNLVHVARLMAKAGIEHYHPIPYPKTHVVRNERGKLVAAVWPANHPKAGLPVIFEDEAEEAAYHAGAA